MFEVRFNDSALEDLQHFKKAEQKTVLEAIEDQLIADPLTETRNRKPLRPNDLSSWELRVGSQRVFYDVDEESRMVVVKAVGKKEHNKLYIRGKEHQL